MQRLSMTLTDPQHRWLQREAKRIGISIAELIRRIIDEKRDGGAVSHPAVPDHNR